jgi:TatD DNase family protein
MKVIDSHCHLDDFFKAGRINEVLKNAEHALVEKMIAVGTHLDDWEFYCEFVRGHKNVFYTVGLHPLCVEHVDNLKKLPNFLEMEINPVAIGEIGLDYHRLPKNEAGKLAEIELQRNVFVEQLELARAHDLPVVIHSRDAFADTLEILKNSGIPGERILFHCYSYGVGEIEEVKRFGAFVSFSGNITYKQELIEPLEAAPSDRTLVETDCPYLTPQFHKPKQNEPAYIRATVEFAAKILNMAESDFCALTYENTLRFFGIG